MATRATARRGRRAMPPDGDPARPGIQEATSSRCAATIRTAPNVHAGMRLMSFDPPAKPDLAFTDVLGFDFQD